MDIITTCIRRITRSDIPRQILEDAFLGNRIRLRREPETIESRIRDEIIYGMVRADMNTVGGTQVNLNLGSISCRDLSNWQRIYRVPTRYTGGRAITQAHFAMLNLVSNYAESLPNTQSGTYRRSTIDNSANRLVLNNSPIPNRMNAEIELLGDNVLKVNNWQNMASDMNVILLLEYSENLIEIKKPYWPVVAECAVLAAKAYIYRELSLLVDKTRLEGGRDFGRYREFIDEYRDANQQYEEKMFEGLMSKVSVLADQNRKQRHIQNTGKLMA